MYRRFVIFTIRNTLYESGQIVGHCKTVLFINGRFVQIGVLFYVELLIH